MHWLGARTLATSSDPFRLVSMVEQLPYQDGCTLPSKDTGSTKILASVATIESRTNSTLSHTQEVLMVLSHHRFPCHKLSMFNLAISPCPTSQLMPQHLPTRQKTRGLQEKGRTSSDRLTKTEPSITTKNGSDIKLPAAKSSNSV